MLVKLKQNHSKDAPTILGKILSQGKKIKQIR